MQKFEINGRPLDQMVASTDFVPAVYFLWTGKDPEPKQAQLLNACLVALIDHGPDALSAQTARMAVSGGAEFHAAVAAGFLAAGKHHGTIPLQKAAMLFIDGVEKNKSADEVVQSALKQGQRLPGFGHRIYKEEDPRTMALLTKAQELGLRDQHVDFALEVEKELERQKGKMLCLNVDGAVGALLPALGVPAEFAPGLFLVARSAGLAKHVVDEMNEPPASMRRA